MTLLRLENVVLTPHVAWYTTEAEDYILQSTIDSIRAFVKGSPINVVNQRELENMNAVPTIHAIN